MKYTVWYLLFVLSTLPHLFSLLFLLPSYFLSFNLVFTMSMTHCRSSTSPPPPHPTIPHCTPPSDSYLQSDTSELTTDLSEPTQRTRDVRLFWQTLFFRPLKLWLMPLSSNPDWNLTSRWPGCCFNDVFPWMSRWGHPPDTHACGNSATMEFYCPAVDVPWNIRTQKHYKFPVWRGPRRTPGRTLPSLALSRPALVWDIFRQKSLGLKPTMVFPWHWDCKRSHVMDSNASSGPFFFPPTVVYCDVFLISHSCFNLAQQVPDILVYFIISEP